MKGILEAFQRQLVDDGEYSQALNVLEAEPVPDAPPVIDEEEEMYKHFPNADMQIQGPVIDTNTGAELDL